MSETREIVAELDALGGIIARAESDLAADTVLDLAPLEPFIEDLCCRIENLPPEQGRDMQPRLLALVDDFGRLNRSIERKMIEIKGQIGDASGRQQAMTAYSKSSEPGK